MTGSVHRFSEGFWMGAYPQLASYLYTWAFLLPVGTLFDRLELCAHVEFVLFLATLAQIPSLVRVILPRARAPLAWVALFLFPGIFLYPSNLHAGADHIAAFWTVPIAVSFWLCWRNFTLRYALLFAITLSGAVLSAW